MGTEMPLQHPRPEELLTEVSKVPELSMGCLVPLCGVMLLSWEEGRCSPCNDVWRLTKIKWISGQRAIHEPTPNPAIRSLLGALDVIVNGRIR
jgi:hypothetical protein